MFDSVIVENKKGHVNLLYVKKTKENK